MAHNSDFHNIDTIIQQLLSLDPSVILKTRTLSSKNVLKLCEYSIKLFLNEPMLLELEAPIRICGNICGHYNSLIKIITTINFPLETNLLFLGSYIDRGQMGIECLCLLLALKIKYPRNIFLLRGSHESQSINRIYGFYDECKHKYNPKLWKEVNKCFDYLPIAALVNDKFFCVHSGISPELKLIHELNNIKRPINSEDCSLVVDLLWADPCSDIESWGCSNCGPSYTFGESVIRGFLRRNELELICRSHQVVEPGYEYFANQSFLTIFPIEKYLDYNNSGVVLDLDKALNRKFVEIHIDDETSNVSSSRNCIDSL